MHVRVGDPQLPRTHRHAKRESETEGDRYTFIGVYSTRDNAKRAVTSLRDKPNFKETPNNFGIYENTVDMIGWPEGFGTWSANDPDGTLGPRPQN